MDIHSNELLGECEIRFMNDLKTLDDPIDQTHGKFNWWVR